MENISRNPTVNIGNCILDNLKNIFHILNHSVSIFPVVLHSMKEP